MRHSQYDRVLSSRSTDFHIAANVALCEINCITTSLPLNIVSRGSKCTLWLNITKSFHLFNSQTSWSGIDRNFWTRSSSYSIFLSLSKIILKWLNEESFFYFSLNLVENFFSIFIRCINIYTREHLISGCKGRPVLVSFFKKGRKNGKRISSFKLIISAF